MKRETVYIETSVVSYLCARPSRDLIVAANQEITRAWWDRKRPDYDCFVSELVLQESMAGDPKIAEKRTRLISDLPILVITDAITTLAAAIMRGAKLPESVENDISHIAIATYHRMDYLLTLNCRHIANPHWQRKMREVTKDMDATLPVLCTPHLLYEGSRKG
uniref:PIN domain-containing protein n=1 Tax=Candidatus Kentrum sp. LFY TaxID=2126342 RepID=A0A450V2X6_9GAMM|nr:MAG: PIN domain-containing protein [Candidatus Kentron sp. LFY]